MVCSYVATCHVYLSSTSDGAQVTEALNCKLDLIFIKQPQVASGYYSSARRRALE